MNLDDMRTKAAQATNQAWHDGERKEHLASSPAPSGAAEQLDPMATRLQAGGQLQHLFSYAREVCRRQRVRDQQDSHETSS